jgi:hypothetical protein
MPSAGKDEKLGEIERLTHSSVLHHSDSLCHLLRFLARHSLDRPGMAIKEYQIATEVFGRPTDFDPRIDSTVRVQASRLRSKLAEYYAAEGIADDIVVEVPKGSYALEFHERAGAGAELAAFEPRPVTLPQAPNAMRRSISAVAAIGGVTAITLVLLAVWSLRSASEPAPALGVFWSRFIGDSQPPLVVFSNAEFVGRPETGLRYFAPASDESNQILDHYTGVGEVMAIHALGRLFEQFRRPFQLKRGRLLNWDDARNRNVIFVGSPSENLPLRALSVMQEFRFQTIAGGERAGDLGIINLNPRRGEQEVYLANRSLPIVEDYALVALVPGLQADCSILVLAGTTTFGTQAAVEFVCQAAKVQGLLQKLGKLSSFAGVLRVKINGGVPVESDLVALHPLP